MTYCRCGHADVCHDIKTGCDTEGCPCEVFKEYAR